MRSVEVSDRVDVGHDNSQFILPNYQEEVAGLLTTNKEKFLSKFFTNPLGNVTAIRGAMPSVLAGTLIARFSRAEEFDITELFWKEFVVNPELGIQALAETLEEEEGLESHLAKDKARKIIRRILDGYGDDSVREEASAYVVARGTSVLTSMEVFINPLATGIEASTRYIDWGQKDNGEYNFTKPLELMNSEHAETYTKAMDYLFDTYRELWPMVLDYVVSKNPRPDNIDEGAYKRAIKGRVCDNLRKLLPLGIKTNFGIHADYRTLSESVMNLRASEVPESRSLADEIANELLKINPEFIEIVNSEHGAAWTRHQRSTREEVKSLPNVDSVKEEEHESKVGVEVLTKDYLFQILRSALAERNAGESTESIDEEARLMIRYGSWENFFKGLGEARKNRRHKLPTFFNSVTLRVRLEGISFGSFKDINRHRNIEDKTEPDWSGEKAEFIPVDIDSMGGEARQKYLKAQEVAFLARRAIAKDFPIEARRLLTHGTKTTVEITMSLAEAFWIAELRSIPSGDPEYRKFAQMLYEQLIEKMPELKLLGSFVDMKDYQVGRIDEAVKSDLKGKS